MRDSNYARLLASLASLVLLLTRFTIATITSGTFEVDVLFPRNDTYAPQALMPFVFALQKPALVKDLVANIFWGIWPGSNSTIPAFNFNGVFQPASPWFTPNLSNIDQPFYISDAVNTLEFPDGPWTFSWTIYVNNCSMQSAAVLHNGSLIFTTSKNAKAPDLVAATAPDTCRNATGYAFDVLSVNPRPCGVLGPYVPSAANPCAASIHAAAASSIQATATANACQLGQAAESSNAACPKVSDEPSASESGSAATASASYIAWVVAAAFLVSAQ